MKTNKNNKITSLTSFEELRLLLSNSEKESLKIEDEKRLKQLKEAKEKIEKINNSTLDKAK